MINPTMAKITRCPMFPDAAVRLSTNRDPLMGHADAARSVPRLARPLENERGTLIGRAANAIDLQLLFVCLFADLKFNYN